MTKKIYDEVNHFSAIAHLQKARITTSSENVPDSCSITSEIITIFVNKKKSVFSAHIRKYTLN